MCVSYGMKLNPFPCTDNLPRGKTLCDEAEPLPHVQIIYQGVKTYFSIHRQTMAAVLVGGACLDFVLYLSFPNWFRCARMDIVAYISRPYRV